MFVRRALLREFPGDERSSEKRTDLLLGFPKLCCMSSDDFPAISDDCLDLLMMSHELVLSYDRL